MARPIAVIDLTPEEKAVLRRRISSPTASRRDAWRARIVLLRAAGRREQDVAAELGVSINTVSLWLSRFEENGLDGLSDRPGRGRKPWLAPEKIHKVVTEVTRPPQGRNRWGPRTMAAAAGMSHQSVHAIWKENDLKPHRVRTFKISSDPRFEEKFWDIIGLYLKPPEKALLLCCDEKKPMSGLGEDPAGPAAGDWRGADADARLPTAWHHHPVCGPELTGRQVDHPDRAKPYAGGMGAVSPAD